VNEPGDLATWANAVTVGRVLLSPVMYAIINGPRGSWFAIALWFVLCASDGVDGWLARRHGTTRSGAFLDPLADKILVLGAMFVLVNVHMFWWLPVAIIAAREVAISLYRTVVGTKGVSVPAKKLAKLKTLTQQLAIGFALLPPTARHARWLWVDLLWLAVVLTVVSGAQYFYHARRKQPARAM
jgi:CDP-diacylglycerol---glycerol-3-phosphate 3-phosphatidyltransferase